MAEKQCNLLKNGGGTGTKLKSVSSTSNKTYAYQLNELAPYFTALSSQQKRTCILQMGSTPMHCSDDRGVFSTAWTTATAWNVRTVSMRSGNVYYCDAQNNTFYNNTNSNNSESLTLYWYE